MNQSRIIKTLLERYQIPYWEVGKNCSEDYINVQCPFCNDHSNHNGINRESLIFHCWKCGLDGSFAYLLSRLSFQSIQECFKLIREAGFEYDKDIITQLNEIFYPSETETNSTNQQLIQLPQYFELITAATEYPPLNSWMIRRKVDKQTLIANRCGVCTVGKYMCRMIIPLYFDGQLVSYIAADLTGKAEKKYVNANNDIKEYLYGWDNVDWNMSTLVLVEGVLDQWRVGYNAVASLGTAMSDKQHSLIIKSKVENLVICFDSDAILIAQEEAERFADFINNVVVVELPPPHDPDSYGTEETWDLIFKTLARRMK